MKKLLSVILGFTLSMGLGACVEVRDQDEGGTPTPAAPVVQVQHFPAMELSGEMYIYQGRILSLQEFQYEIYKAGGAVDRSVRDLEFHFDSLTLAQGTRLFTLGNRVRIHAGVLESYGGRIETFPEGQTAEHGVPGRSGGYLVLKVKQALGSLSVTMRGEHGAPGSPGSAAGPELDGKPAKPVRVQCQKNGTFKGPDGESGKRGYPGSDGTDGGSSGLYEIYVDSLTQFEHVVQSYPGQGGVGGQGGPGGKGAAAPALTGGVVVGSRIEDIRVCGRERGSDGADGDRGIDGRPGRTGTRDRRCLTSSGQTTCD